MNIVLAFHSSDHSDLDQIRQEAGDIAPRAQVICRNGDHFTGWIERQVGNRDVVGVYAPKHPAVAAAYAAAGIPVVEILPPELEPGDNEPVVITDEGAPIDPPAEPQPKKSKKA